jgi:hypothetical protein
MSACADRTSDTRQSTCIIRQVLETRGHARVRRDEFVDGKHVRKQQRVRLAAATVPEREVKKIATEYLRPLNQGLESLGSATNFEHFIETIYKPVGTGQIYLPRDSDRSNPASPVSRDTLSSDNAALRFLASSLSRSARQASCTGSPR